MRLGIEREDTAAGKGTDVEFAVACGHLLEQVTGGTREGAPKPSNF